ncbi:MAG: hypothetical protein WCV80_00575 [Candidatus Paceibacterota bacterium]|jgi:hypothetical protein
MKKIIKPSLILVYIFTAAVYILGPIPESLLTQTLYLILPTLSVVFGFYAINSFGFRSATGKALFITTLGLSCWAIGEFTWYWLRSILNVDPFPTISDFFFILGYPLLFVGMYMHFKLMSVSFKGLDKYMVAFNFLVIIILAILVSYFGIYKAYNPIEGVFNNVIIMLYGLGDLALLIASLFALQFISLYRGGKFRLFWWYISFGFLSLTIADILFAIYRGPYTTYARPYAYLDLVWLLGHLFIVLGMFYYGSTIRDARKKAEKELANIT